MVIGIINTADTAVFSHLFNLFLDKNLSGTLGYAVALIIGYLLNCLLVFKATPTVTRFIKYAVSYIPNFLIYTVISVIAINLLGLKTIIATALAAVIGVPVTFVILKIFAFRKN